jgi:hypothetical protein
MVRGGPGSYTLRMNESEIEAEIHTLRDGGLLMQASFFFRTFLSCTLPCSCLDLDCIYEYMVKGKPIRYANS